MESELRPEGLLGSYPGWGGKLAGFALRLAGLLHVAEYGLVKQDIHVVKMQNALRLIEVLRLHALTVFQWMCRDSASDDAQIVWQWIQSRGQGSFTQAEIRFALRNKKQGQSERLMKAISPASRTSFNQPAGETQYPQTDHLIPRESVGAVLRFCDII